MVNTALQRAVTARPLDRTREMRTHHRGVYCHSMGDECCNEVVYLYVGNSYGLGYCNHHYDYYDYYFVLSFFLSFFGIECPSIAGLSGW